VIVLGEDMKNRIRAKGINAAKIEIVRDGTEITEDSADAPVLDREVIRKIRSGFRFVLLHAGNLGFYGAWGTLLAAARELTLENIGFVFVGEGAHATPWRRKLQEFRTWILAIFSGEQDSVGACAADVL